MPTLLEYLTQENPVIDRSYLRSGSNTTPLGDYEVEGVRPWTDFNLNTVLQCFPDVLEINHPSECLHEPSPIAKHHLKPTDESCVETILKKNNHTIVDRALELAAPILEGRGLLPLSMSWGALGTVHEFRPDWAGVVPVGNPPYVTRIPGETKQSTKWNSSLRGANRLAVRDEFFKSLRQMVLYCDRANTRYGYVITDLEAVFFRRTRSEDPPESLSMNRPPRLASLATHNRVASINSVVSGISEMSLDSSGSPYTDEGNPDVNEAPLEIAIVPWKNGPGTLTINLALWFIHMLGASEVSVEKSYPILGSWHKFKDVKGLYYQQEGSHRVTRIAPKEGRVVKKPVEPKVV